MSKPREPRSSRQERDKVPLSRLATIAIALNLIGAVLVTWSWLTLRAREAALRPSGVFPEQHLGPRREISGVEQELFGDRGSGQDLTAREQKSLESYEWVDRKTKTVRIPIDVAMDLVVRAAANPPAPPTAPEKAKP